MVSGTTSVAPSLMEASGLLSVAGARHDAEAGSERARRDNHRFGRFGQVHRHDHGQRGIEAQPLQHVRLSGIAKDDVVPLAVARSRSGAGPRSMAIQGTPCRASMSATSLPTRP